jgi:hypothetical protein
MKATNDALGFRWMNGITIPSAFGDTLRPHWPRFFLGGKEIGL